MLSFIAPKEINGVLSNLQLIGIIGGVLMLINLAIILFLINPSLFVIYLSVSVSIPTAFLFGFISLIIITVIIRLILYTFIHLTNGVQNVFFGSSNKIMEEKEEVDYVENECNVCKS